MSFYFFLNNKSYDCLYIKPYEHIFKLDMTNLNMYCKLYNSFQIITFSPRTNIYKMLLDVNFFFSEPPLWNQYGMINGFVYIYYNKKCFEKRKCTLFFHGFLLTNLYIYMPVRDNSFIRELKFRDYTRITENCCICLDYCNEIINIHQNEYNHFVCSSCLVKIDKCPICRLKI